MYMYAAMSRCLIVRSMLSVRVCAIQVNLVVRLACGPGHNKLFRAPCLIWINPPSISTASSSDHAPWPIRRRLWSPRRQRRRRSIYELQRPALPLQDRYLESWTKNTHAKASWILLWSILQLFSEVVVVVWWPWDGFMDRSLASAIRSWTTLIMSSRDKLVIEATASSST
jgi:hypothetical protein